MAETNENKAPAKKKINAGMTVEMLTGAYKAYVKGDIATFDKKTAEMLIEKKVAKKYKA